MSGRAELRALTSARGVAAWWVVLYHLRGALADLPAAAQALVAKGYLAVDFFFLLSGFVLAFGYGERLHGGGRPAILDFLRRRIARIWPLHAAMLGVALLLALLLRTTGHATQQFPLAELPVHLLLVQAWGFTNPLCWNDPAWSISCELMAYLLFPLWVVTIDWRRRRAVTLIAILAALFALLHGVFVLRGATELGQDLQNVGLIRCVLEFTAGAILYALWNRQRAERSGRNALAIAAMLAAAWAAGMPETAVAPALLAAILWALATASGQRGNPLEGALLHRLGEISYATYLSHFLLWFVFKLAFVRTATIGWPLAALYLVLVLAASVALHHWVERPAQRWINALGFRPGRSRLPARRSPRG
nr:acyltransferase [uncultured Sphingomonas sp.]